MAARFLASAPIARRLGAFALSVSLLGGGAALAQTPTQPPTIATSKVSAVTATVYARCDPSSPARVVLERGAPVTIESVNGAWVQVRVAGNESGCMRRSDLEASAAVDSAADAQRRRQQGQAAPASPRRRAPISSFERVILSINASYLTASDTFDDTRTFDLYAEQGRFTTDYEVQARVGVDAGGFVKVWRNVAAGVAFTSYKDDGDLAIEGSVPHPLLFNKNRSVSGTAPGSREETAVHIQAAYVAPVGKKMSVVIFGGPSFFTVKQSVVTGIHYTDAYPYDEAQFTTADVASEEEKKVGFNVGADVAYYLTKNVGVGGIVRFSKTTVTFSLGDVDAGGAMIGGGVRLRF